MNIIKFLRESRSDIYNTQVVLRMLAAAIAFSDAIGELGQVFTQGTSMLRFDLWLSILVAVFPIFYFDLKQVEMMLVDLLKEDEEADRTHLGE